jgi:hypothetical protein
MAKDKAPKKPKPVKMDTSFNFGANVKRKGNRKPPAGGS